MPEYISSGGTFEFFGTGPWRVGCSPVPQRFLVSMNRGKYITRTAHSEALIVRGTGYNDNSPVMTFVSMNIGRISVVFGEMTWGAEGDGTFSTTIQLPYSLLKIRRGVQSEAR